MNKQTLTITATATRTAQGARLHGLDAPPTEITVTPHDIHGAQVTIAQHGGKGAQVVSMPRYQWEQLISTATARLEEIDQAAHDAEQGAARPATLEEMRAFFADLRAILGTDGPPT